MDIVPKLRTDQKFGNVKVGQTQFSRNVTMTGQKRYTVYEHYSCVILRTNNAKPTSQTYRFTGPIDREGQIPFQTK